MPAVIGLGVWAGPLQATVAAKAPDRTPEQVLALVAQSRVDALSGTIEQTSDLGLPQLPKTGLGATAGAASWVDMLTAPHTARVYLDGPTRMRVQVLDQLAERDLVRSGPDLWTYNSSDNTVTHVTMPARGFKKTLPSALPARVESPDQLARQFLSAVGPTTRVSEGPQSRMAGRAAYHLILSPRTTDTLIGSVDIAVDAATGLPLGVTVLARGQEKPALQVQFTQLSLAAPAADVFRFVPPAGAHVQQLTLPQRPVAHPDAKLPNARLPDAKLPGVRLPGHMIQGETHRVPVTVAGTGWDAVIEAAAGTVSQQMLDNPAVAAMMHPVTGGRALSTSVFTVFVATDGRLFAGAVPLERLQAAAAAR